MISKITKKTAFIIFLSASFNVNAEMVELYMASAPTTYHKYKESCNLTETGYGYKKNYFIIKGEPNSRTSAINGITTYRNECVIQVSKEIFYRNFEFCALSKSGYDANYKGSFRCEVNDTRNSGFEFISISKNNSQKSYSCSFTCLKKRK